MSQSLRPNSFWRLMEIKCTPKLLLAKKKKLVLSVVALSQPTTNSNGLSVIHGEIIKWVLSFFSGRIQVFVLEA